MRRDIHVLARAVIRADGRVLLARCKGASNTFLPGGHVAEGERMHDALARELREEFGEPCEVGRYIGAIEHAFTENGVTQHEVNHLFEVTLPNVLAASALQSLESHLEFFWHPIADLATASLKPEPAGRFIRSLDSGALWASTLQGSSAGVTPHPRPTPAATRRNQISYQYRPTLSLCHLSLPPRTIQTSL